MISDNVFENNSGLTMGANAIKIDMATAESYDTEFTASDMF